jgi:hypothetical protein
MKPPQLRLATPIANPPYMSLNTPETPAVEAPGANGLVYGWGSTEDSGDAMSAVLRGVSVPVVCCSCSRQLDLYCCRLLFMPVGYRRTK